LHAFGDFTGDDVVLATVKEIFNGMRVKCGPKKMLKRM
jgi:hypothetical protein